MINKRFKIYDRDHKKMIICDWSTHVGMLLVSKVPDEVVNNSGAQVLLLFTGVYDIRGNEICEGDLVLTSDGWQGEVMFLMGRFVVTDGGYTIGLYEASMKRVRLEICGNAYDVR